MKSQCGEDYIQSIVLLSARVFLWLQFAQVRLNDGENFSFWTIWVTEAAFIPNCVISPTWIHYIADGDILKIVYTCRCFSPGASARKKKTEGNKERDLLRKRTLVRRLHSPPCPSRHSFLDLLQIPRVWHRLESADFKRKRLRSQSVFVFWLGTVWAKWAEKNIFEASATLWLSPQKAPSLKIVP